MGHGPIIGVLTPSAGGMYYGGLLHGIAHAVAVVDGRAIAIQTLPAGYLNDDYLTVPQFQQPLAWDHVAGFIVIVNAAPPEYLARIHRTGKPIVSISNNATGLDCAVVMPDNRTGVREAVRHLVGHGHSRIGFTGFLGQTDIRERHEAYRAAMLECGLQPVDAHFFAINDNDERGGLAAAAALRAAGMPTTAMVAGTDLNAIGLMAGLTAAGYVLPEDQAVVGFDDAEAAGHVTPSLSSVKQDFGAVGSLAVELLLQAAGGAYVAPGRREVSTAFVARESCGCSGWRPPVTDAPRGTATASDDLARALLSALQPVDAVSSAAVALAVEQVARLFAAAVSGTELPPIGGVRQALGDVQSRWPTLEVAAAIVDGIRAFAQAYKDETTDQSTARRIDDAVIGCIWALLQVQGSGSYQRQTRLLGALDSQYEVGMKLLRGLDRDASHLAWLARTPATAGVLGLWSGPQQTDLTVVGAYARDGEPVGTTGDACRVQAFPPVGIFGPAPQPRHMLFAVPVQGPTSNHGWFVTSCPIESVALTGREAQNQWAAFLTVALDEAEAADKLKSLEREWHAILENTPDALARYDTQLRYEYLNAAAGRSLGKEPIDIVGRTDAELGRDQSVTGIWEAGLRHVLTSGSPTQVEFSEGVDADLRWFQARMVPQRDSEGVIVGVLASSRDLTAVKKAEIALAYQAVHDSLTGLANRVLFVDRLSHSLTRMEREPGRIAVLFIDLDRFKDVNDSLGHDTGDRLLVEVAERLRAASRRVDTVARVGGDEFVILCDKLSSDDDVRIIGERVVRSLSRPFIADGVERDVSASVGVVVTSDSFTEAAMLLRNADAAMYQAKENGGNRFQLFDPGPDGRATTRTIGGRVTSPGSA